MSTEILIIDDNPDIRNILKDLISDAGYETRVAANYNQALNEIDKNTIKSSGCPFSIETYKELSNRKYSEALNHPTWNMGTKNTIDSASLMNKGLEVIEASVLFSLPSNKINVLVHPESIIHGICLLYTSPSPRD